MEPSTAAHIEPFDPSTAQQVFKAQRPKLMRAISCGSDVLINKLYSDGVITESALNKLMVMGLPKDEKSMILLNEVERMITIKSSAFGKFVSALQSEPPLVETAEQLLRSYCSYHDMICSLPTILGPGSIAHYASYLRNYYSTSPISQAYKWPLTSSTRYINPAIIESGVSKDLALKFTQLKLQGNIDQILREKSPLEIAAIFEPQHDQKRKFILVEGAPGVGKSTFAWELCRRWDVMEVLRKYSLVVLVRLCDEGIHQATSLAGFFDYPNGNVQQVIKSIGDGEGLLLIMDGADECPSSFWKNPQSLGCEILSGRLLPKATVLVTTRPSASTILTSQWIPQKHIEVLGFTTAQISKYAESVVASKPDLEGFHRYISASPSISGILYIPLNTVIAMGVYRENRGGNRLIPTTLTQLYTDLTLILLQRYLLANSLKLVEALPQTMHDFPETILKTFHDLAKTAYEGTVKQQGFSKLPEGSNSLGFTTESAMLPTGRRLSYHFLHLTLQEYLAAFHFSLLPEMEQKKVFEEHCHTSHLNMMWIFVAGLTRFKGIGLEVVKQAFAGDSYLSMSFLRLMYETQERETIQAVLGSETIDINESYNDPFTTVHTRLDYFALGYCIINSRCSWKLFLRPQSHEQLKMLFLGVKLQSQLFSSIHTLKIWDFKLKESAQHFKELPLHGFQELYLRKCGLDNPAFSSLAHSVISGMKKLKILDVSENEVSSSGSLELLRVLSKIQTLRVLNLGRLTLGCDDISALEPLVDRRDGNLNELTVGSRHVEAAAVRQMIALLLAPSSLQRLFIEYTTLQPSADNLAELLETNHNLETLGMDYCWGGATACAKALCKNSTLRTLIINWSEIREAGASLAEALKVNQSLEKLRIDFDYDIGEEGETSLQILNDALQHNNTVELQLPPKYRYVYV